MNERKLVQNFKSYINVSPKNNGEKNGSMQELKPRLLKNELIVGEAHNVVMLRTLSEGGDSGRYGSLFVTNYRLSFVPLEPEPQDEWGQRNTILGTYDVPLGTVGTIWLTDGGPVRRRRLQPIGDIQGKVKGLQVVCKNMKVLTFSMLSCAMGKGRSVAMALLHHAYPKRHDLLFAFECKEPTYTAPSPNINMFLRPSDWKRELERCACAHWRMTCVNGTSDAFMHSAGETLIVPGSVLDYSLMETARHFRSGSIPIWVWGRASGAALLRCGELLPTEHSATAESVYLEQVRKSHPKLTPPHVIYPCGNSYTGGGGPNTLPSLSSLHNSYKRLVDLCTPATLSAFWIADSQYYALLDSSRWPRSVSSCLALADEAASRLEDNCTVLLQEGDGVDYAAVVSSLTQLLVDPHFRSIDGFQSLVQKEWVALGHPFCDRFGLPRPGTASKDQPRATSERAPVFLLFIECVWQLTRQFPQDFEFTDTYLTTLWDAAHNHLFDTFIFNCPRDRDLQFAKDYIQRPVWDWSKQFSEQDIALFYNPLYNLDKTTLQSPLPSSRMSTLTQPTAEFPRLKPSTGLSSMEMWSQCYERWLTPLQGGAGNYHYYVYNKTLLQQIKQLKERLATLAIVDESVTLRPIERPPPIHVDVPRFYPFCQSTTYAPQASLQLMQTGGIDASRLLDSQSLLNAPD